MEALNTSLGEVYFYIKNGLIFDIKNYDNGDECAKKGVSSITNSDKDVAVPFFKVTETESQEITNYFLTNFITDGDSYSDGSFYKHNDESQNAISIYKYFEKRCEETVKAAIKNYPQEELNFFKKNKNVLNIPPFMIKDNGYTVSSEVSQINLDTKFNTWKKEVVQQEAWNAANNRANSFNYKVTLNVEELTVEKKS